MTSAAGQIALIVGRDGGGIRGVRFQIGGDRIGEEANLDL